MANEVSTSIRTGLKENFIDTLMAAGERRLLDGDKTGLDMLATASDLAPQNPQLFHKQGLAIFDYACHGRPKALHIANQKFKRATELAPKMFESWLSWANCLFLLGTASGQQHYYLDAKDKFEFALKLCEGQPSEFLLDLYWNYGLCMGRIAIESEDPLDLQLAYTSFKKASLLREEQPTDFWCDFGHLALRLFGTLGDIKYLQSAIELYTEGTRAVDSDYAPWVYLGDALALSYGLSKEPAGAEHASDCYAAAANIHPSDPQIWIKWAQLLCCLGRATGDSRAFCAAIEKCHKARSFDASEVELTCVWAETLAALGALKNRLKHLRRAEDMLDELCENHPQNPAIHYSNGHVLLALADYFNCIDIYFRAVESFQKATSLDRTFHAAWHALGTCYMLLSTHEEDVELQLERAVRFFSKALHLRQDPSYHYDLGAALYRLADEKLDKTLLSQAIDHIETALDIQRNAAYTCVDWIYTYSCALALSGQLTECEEQFIQSLDHLHHILMIDPNFPELNHRFALTYNQYGDTVSDPDLFQRSFHHFRIAHTQEPDNDQILHGWAISLMNLNDISEDPNLLAQAENKLFQAVKLGNASAYYTLGNLYAGQGNPDRALFYLEKAHKFQALPEIEELIEDEWLEPLHDYPAFQAFISRIQQDANK